MNGMIFAAGLGTRLKPLTDSCPKAMVELKGKPLLEYVILKMKQSGIKRIVVNVHHFAGQITEFLNANNNFGCDIVISDEQEELLDTGGGLLKAVPCFIPNEPVLIHNVDIFSDIDLTDLIQLHTGRNDYVTLVTRPATGNRVLRFNRNGVLKGWENRATKESKILDNEFYDSESFSFCGIHVVSPAFLNTISYKGVFSIIDEYLLQAGEHELRKYDYSGRFIDLGTPAAIEEAEKWF